MDNPVVEHLLGSRRLAEAERAAAHRRAEDVLFAARAAGRDRLSPAEDVVYREAEADLRRHAAKVAAIDERLVEVRADDDRHSQIDATLSATFGAARHGGSGPSATSLASTTPGKSRTMRTDDRSLTYRKDDPNRSYIRDLVTVHQRQDDTGEARARLQAHGEEMRRLDLPEYRTINGVDRTPGNGGFFAPPYWAVEDYVDFARAGRPFANLIQNRPLPGGCQVVDVPKILTGTATAVQTNDLAQVVEQDITDTFISSPIKTIAGQQTIALQLIEQSPLNFDAVILNDLTASQAQTVDQQALYGSGSNGQILGVSNWPGISTIACSDSDSISGIYGALANAVNLIWTSRFAQPTAVVMHPRRWASCLQMLDAANRPLFLPESQRPMNAAGIMDNLQPQAVVGRVLDMPIVVDANLATTLGSGSPTGTQDAIYVLKADDVVLYESGLRTRIMVEPFAQNLAVLCQVYSYIALAVRYAASIVEITGLTPPAFG